MRNWVKAEKLCFAVALGMAASRGARLPAQVQTIVPAPIPGAKQVAVEHIKIHGPALEGNLEGDAVDRDVIDFLPPSYAPLAFVDQYIGNLKQYRAIAIDVGDQDGLRIDAGKLHDVLDNYGIANSFEIYPGTHTSAVADRFQNHVMPFFSRNLCFEAVCK